MEALIGLIGVGVGALVTAGIQTWADWRRRRLESRTAARILFGELNEARMGLEQCLEEHGWWPDEFELAPRGLWRDYRDKLAAVMTNHDWHALAGALKYLERLQLNRDTAAASGQLGTAFDEWATSRIPDAIAQIDHALVALAIYGASRRERRQLGLDSAHDELEAESPG
jgi:hypothetical protein